MLVRQNFAEEPGVRFAMGARLGDALRNDREEIEVSVRRGDADAYSIPDANPRRV